MGYFETHGSGFNLSNNNDDEKNDDGDDIKLLMFNARSTGTITPADVKILSRRVVEERKRHRPYRGKDFRAKL